MKNATATITVTLFLASILNIALAASVTKFSACKNQFSIGPNPTEHVVINEFDQNPPGWDAPPWEGFPYKGREWVELFNPAENDVDISGWKLSTTHGETVTVTIPEGTKIAAKDFWVYTHDTQWLDDKDESIILYDADGNEIDRTPTTTDTENYKRCWARYPNGKDTDSDTDWRFVNKWESTKGYNNIVTTVVSGDTVNLQVGEKRKFLTLLADAHMHLWIQYGYKVIECPDFISYSGSLTGMIMDVETKKTHLFIISIFHVLPSAELGVYDLRVKWSRLWEGSWRNLYELHLKVNVVPLDTTPPMAHAGPDQTVDEGTLVTFDGSGSSDNIGITSYTWTFMDVTPQTLTGVNPTYTFATPGTYTVTLKVIDAVANSATDTVVITCMHVDVTSPVADAGSEQTVDQDTLVTFDASGSTDNVDIVSYAWDFGDGTTGSGVTTTHTYTQPKTYTITLTVSDAAGNSATDTVMITVLDVTNPTADAGTDKTVRAGETVSFNAEGCTDNVAVVSYEWEFGDGTTGTGITTTHIYTEPGNYTVTLTVGDAAGNRDVHSRTITVEPPPVGAFPLWIVGAAAAIIAIGIAVATTILWKKRK